MFMQFVSHINWVDLVILALLVRIVYVSADSGFITEFFKSLGLILGLFVAFHYYVVLGNLANKFQFPVKIVHAVTFAVLWLVVAILFEFFKRGVLNLFTVQAQSLIDKWGAVILGLLRFVVTASMLVYLLLIPGVQYLNNKVVGGSTPMVFLRVAPGMYTGICDHFVSRLFDGERINPAVHEIMNQVSPR